jgi:hypothetical protein
MFKRAQATEVNAVHVDELRDAPREFARAILVAVILTLLVFISRRRRAGLAHGSVDRGSSTSDTSAAICRRSSRRSTPAASGFASLSLKES